MKLQLKSDIKIKKLECFYEGAVTIHERLLMAEIQYLLDRLIFYINFLEKLSLAGSDLMDCCYPRRDRKGDIGNVDDMVIKTIALNCPRLKYIDLYKGK